MKTVLILLAVVVAVIALIVFLSRRASQRKVAARREAEAVRAQVEADLAAYRKVRSASETRTIASGSPVSYSGGVAKPVASKPSPKSKAAKKDYSSDSDSDDTVYGYVAPDYGYSTYTDYSSGSSDSGSSGSSGSSYSSGSSDSGYSSGGSSSSSSYDSGSSSSSSDSGSSW